MKFVAAILASLALIAAQVLHGGVWESFFVLPACALLALAGIVGAIVALRSPNPPSFLAVLMAAGVFGYLLWRAAFGPDPVLAKADFSVWLTCLVVWGLFAGALTGSRERLTALGILLVVVIAQAALGLTQAFGTGAPWDLWFSEELRWFYDGKFGNRACGFYLNPNQLAWLMNGAAIYCLGLAVWGRCRVFTRVVLLYLAAMFIAVMIFSASRGGIASLVVGGGAFAFLSVLGVCVGFHHGRLVAVLGIVTAAVAMAAIGWFTYSSSWLAQGRAENWELSENVRALYSEHAFRLFQTEPALGIGAGMFTHGARLYRTGYQPRDAIYAHNDWMQLLAEYGLAGFVLVAAAFGYFVLTGARGFLAHIEEAAGGGARSAGNSMAIAAASWSVSLAFAVHSLVDFNFHIPANALIGAMAVGMMSNAGPVSDRRGRKSIWAGRVCAAGLLLAAGAGAGWYAIKHWAVDLHTLRGQNALFEGSAARALREADAALARAPDSAAAYTVRGKALLGMPAAVRIVRARKGMVEEYIIDDGPSAAARDRAEREEGEAMVRAAADAFVAAVALCPDAREFHLQAGGALAVAGDERAARVHFLEAVRLDPSHAYPYEELGGFFAASGRLEPALHAYRAGAVLPMGSNCGVLANEVREKIQRSDDPASP